MAWHSNCSEIDQSSGERFTDLLGHKWDKEDKFTFKKENVVDLLEGFSKRSCWKFLAQLWDPIGLLSQVTIKFRIDLQGLWSSGYSWDDILPESIQQAWLENVQSINDLLSFQFDCKLKPNNAVRVSNSRILQWWGAGLCCGHLPTMETCWQTLSSCSSHDKGFRRTSEEEHPKIRTVGLLSTCTRVCYMCECIGVRKNSKLGKILRDRFINRFVLDQNATTGIQAFRICQSS